MKHVGRAPGKPGALSRFAVLGALLTVSACGDLPVDDDADGGSVTVPSDSAVVVPFQYRDDEAQHRLQLRIVNHSDAQFVVDALRLRWDGITTPESAAGLTVVPGQVVDLPVPLADATCGDDPLGDPPSLDDAVAELVLGDGTVQELPVIDAEGTAARLWRTDCERQWIHSQAPISWTDLHVEDIDGRPVTVATLRVERGDASGDIAVEQLTGTVMFIPQSPGLEWPQVLTADRDALEIPVTFFEARCDPHAFAETKQPVSFAVHLTLPGDPAADGDEPVDRAIILPPTDAERDQMMTTLRAGCDVLLATGATQWWEV